MFHLVSANDTDGFHELTLSHHSHILRVMDWVSFWELSLA